LDRLAHRILIASLVPKTRIVDGVDQLEHVYLEPRKDQVLELVMDEMRGSMVCAKTALPLAIVGRVRRGKMIVYGVLLLVVNLLVGLVATYHLNAHAIPLNLVQNVLKVVATGAQTTKPVYPTAKLLVAQEVLQLLAHAPRFQIVRLAKVAMDVVGALTTILALLLIPLVLKQLPVTNIVVLQLLANLATPKTGAFSAQMKTGVLTKTLLLPIFAAW